MEMKDGVFGFYHDCSLNCLLDSLLVIFLTSSWTFFDILLKTKDLFNSFNNAIYMCMYLYTHTYICVYTYIYDVSWLLVGACPCFSLCFFSVIKTVSDLYSTISVSESLHALGAMHNIYAHCAVVCLFPCSIAVKAPPHLGCGC